MGSYLLAGVSIVSIQTAALGALGGPALETDEPFYPGIGRYRDAKAIIQAALEEDALVRGRKPESDRDKSIAIWRWMMQHLYHSINRPMEFTNNITEVHEEGNGVYDAMKFLNCYQFAICYASSTAIAGMMEAAGYTARGRAVSGHTVHECFYDGDWHYLDHDMAGTCFEADHQTIASVDEILKNRDLLNWDYREACNIPQFPWDKGPGSGVMKGAFSRDPAKSWKYNDHGIAVHPSTLVLRHGERFSRFFNYDRAPWGAKYHWTGLKASEKYCPDGPVRNVTFVYDPPADGKNDGRPREPYVNDRLARYGNGLFEYEPDLSEPVFLQEALHYSNVESTADSPRLRATGEEGSVVLYQWSPYVICGAPETCDCWGKVSDAVVISGVARGDGVKIAVSVNNGGDWEERLVSGEFNEDFSMLCRARYQYLLRLSFSRGSGLDALKVRTVTMCAPSMMPHLHDGTTKVRYSASSLGVVFAEPDLASEPGFERSFHDGKGVRYVGSDAMTRAQITDNSGSWVTMKLDTPGPVKKVAIYAFVGTRSPPRPRCNVAFMYSMDGENFKDIMRKELATDADHWRHWLGGIAEVEGNSREIYLRFYCEPHGTQMRLCRIGGYAWYEIPSTPPVTITHVYKSGGTLRRHVEEVPAGEPERTYRVSCGGKVRNVSVSFEVSQKTALAEASQAGREKAASGKPRSTAARDRTRDYPARGILSIARNYLRAGMTQKAHLYLERVVKEHPESEEAKEAKNLLRQMAR